MLNQIILDLSNFFATYIALIMSVSYFISSPVKYLFLDGSYSTFLSSFISLSSDSLLSLIQSSYCADSLSLFRILINSSSFPFVISCNYYSILIFAVCVFSILFSLLVASICIPTIFFYQGNFICMSYKLIIFLFTLSVSTNSVFFPSCSPFHQLNSQSLNKL